MDEYNVLFFGDFDPPTNDIKYACNILLDHPSIKGVWLCPMSKSKNESDLCSIFCQQYNSDTGKQLTCCTVGKDMGLTPEQLAAWARAKYPQQDFRVASLFGKHNLRDGFPVFSIHFLSARQEQLLSAKKAVIPLVIRNYTPIADGIVNRIKAGKDESRSMYKVIWKYIQEKKIYRE